MKKRIHIALALLICAAMITGCANGAEISDETVSESAVSSVTEVVTSNTEVESSAAAETSAQSVSATETETQTSSEKEIEETKDDFSESTAETSETPAETTVTQTEKTETETQSATIEKTDTMAAPKPNVKPYVIQMPSANGKKTVKNDAALIDYSNADDGYIAAAYSGKSAKAKLRIVCGKTQYDHDLSCGGITEFFPLMGSGDYTVRVYEQISGKSYSLAAEVSFEAKIKSETNMYLFPNKYSDFDKDSDCVKKAAKLCSDKSGTVDKIAAIFGYVTENITYDKDLAKKVTNGLTGYIPDPDRTLKNGKGICFDYASLMTAMCRSQGIPARITVGYAKENIYHAWNEIYTEETGWITPELFLKNKGFNITDATFYSGQKNKKKIGEYISDSSNYSAIYRY